MKKLSFILCMFIHSAVMSQVFLTDGRSELHTYVQAIVCGDTVLRDSIFLGFMKDHSCTAIGNQVFRIYMVVYVDDETSLHINSYELPLEGPLVLTGRNCIVAEDSPNLFQRGSGSARRNMGFWYRWNQRRSRRSCFLIGILIS